MQPLRNAHERLLEKAESRLRKRGEGYLRYYRRNKDRYRDYAQVLLGRCGTDALLYDAQGRIYRVFYTVIATDDDGTGPVLASNLRNFAPTPGYPKVFQARALGRAAERQKIDRIAQSLDPRRLLLPHADPTFGAPVVWEGNGEGGTKAGKYYVLGGNSRTVALLRADPKVYARYAREAERLWPDIWPDAPAGAGRRYIVVRVVSQEGCPTLAKARALNQQCQLTLKQAQGLAGATQASLAGAETPLGEALSLVRGLGLDDLGTDLPPIRFGKTIARDTVESFVEDTYNRRFLQALADKMGQERYSGMMGDKDNAAKLINSVLLAFLPEPLIERGFDTVRQEQALMAMLAPLVTIVYGEKQGDPRIPAGFDLIPYLIDARSVLERIKSMSVANALSFFQSLKRQTTIGSSGLGEDTPLQAMLLALLFKKAEAARDPSVPVEAAMDDYVGRAVEIAEKEKARRSPSLFGIDQSEQADALSPSAPVRELMESIATVYGERQGAAIRATFSDLIDREYEAGA